MPSTSPTPTTIAMVLYPGLSLLDLAGPQGAMGLHGDTLLFAATLDPVTCDTGIAISPNRTFSELPESIDVLFVPGGLVDADAIGDEVVNFVAAAGARARYVTSVCSGSLVLGRAGLLKGYRAATHWMAYDQLALTGAEPVHERVVVDRNRITGGGVTAGIDFGLTLLATLHGEHLAKLTQLMMEYDPAPPFDAGTPERAGPELVGDAVAMLQRLLARAPAREATTA